MVVENNAFICAKSKITNSLRAIDIKGARHELADAYSIVFWGKKMQIVECQYPFWIIKNV